MRKQSDLGDYEINAENEPVVGVSKVGLSGVAVRTANGFTTERTWTEVPDEPRAVAESYFGAEVVVDTEDLKEIAASRER